MISNDGGEDNRIHTNYDTLVSNVLVCIVPFSWTLYFVLSVND